jgi:microcystin-dependent protein
VDYNEADSALFGSTHEYYGTTLPNGYLWPDGGTFNLTDFTELGVVLGGNTKPDLRGRGSFGRDDMGGAAANRITPSGSGILGTTLKAIGGEETHVLATAEVGQHSHVFTTGVGSAHHHLIDVTTDPESGHTHSYSLRSTTTQFAPGANNIGVAPAGFTPGFDRRR